MSTGVPQAMASTTGRPKPSYRLGYTNAVACEYKQRQVRFRDVAQQVDAPAQAAPDTSSRSVVPYFQPRWPTITKRWPAHAQ